MVVIQGHLLKRDQLDISNIPPSKDHDVVVGPEPVVLDVEIRMSTGDLVKADRDIVVHTGRGITKHEVWIHRDGVS